MLEVAIGIVAVSLPALLLALLIGALVLPSYRQLKFWNLAIIFTLKPLVATPLWALTIAALSSSNPAGLQEAPIFLTLLPGAALTVIIIGYFRHLFWPPTWTACLFLALDILRWVNSYLVVRLIPAWPTWGPDIPPAMMLAYLLPSAFAMMAWAVLEIQARLARVATLAP